MYDQTTETPIELLSSRLKYHKDMMDNFSEGSEKYIHHEKMMIRFANAITTLNEFGEDNWY